jgi:lysophospholipase L1-like esterase
VNRSRWKRTASVALASLLGVSVAFSGASAAGAHSAPSKPDSASDVGLRVIGLGDSVLTALDRCHCPGLLVDYAGLVADRVQERIRVQNEAHGSSTSGDLMKVLHDGTVQSEIRNVDLVVIFAGANDFSNAFQRVTDGASPQKQYGPIAARLQHNISNAIDEIHRLNSDAKVVVCGYWNDFKDGAVAQRKYSANKRRAAAEATRLTNEALWHAAENGHVQYLSTLRLFQGRGDTTELLAADGDHLSAKGHAVIAQALADMMHPAEQGSSSPLDPGLTQSP